MAWHVSMDSMRLSQGKPCSDTRMMRQYKHISWHSTRKIWIVQGPHKYIGCSTNLDTAVEIACKHFKVSPEDIRLETSKRTNSSSTDSCKRFAILMRVYRGKHKNEPMVPCDLQDLLQRVHTSRVLWNTQARSLIFPILLSKFPKHRDAIEQSLAITPGKSEVENIYACLVKASELISMSELCDQELRNVGRQSMHHMSFTMLVSKSLKLLCKAQMKNSNVTKNSNVKSLAGRKASPNILLMGKCGATYKVSGLDASLRRSIATWIEFGKELVKAKTPHTCEEWGEEVNRMMAFLRSGKVVGMEGSYRGVWTIRSYLICRMRRDCIRRLDIGDMTARKFMSLFPDQKRQVLQMSGGKFMLHRKIVDVFADAECPFMCV